MGLQLRSPYVWMVRKQNGGSNQCISIYTAILSPESMQQHLISTGSSLYMLPQHAVALRVSRNYSKVANQKKVEILNLCNLQQQI